MLRGMASIDVLCLEDPCSDRRRIVDYLAREGIIISRDQERNLMRGAGLREIYQKPRAIACHSSLHLLCPGCRPRKL